MIKLKNILSENAMSINGLFKTKQAVAKKRQKSWENYVNLMQKSRGMEIKIQHAEKDLLRQREQVMSDMENDEDVLQNYNVGHKGAVARYGKDLDKLDIQLERIRDQKKSLETRLEGAKENSVSWAHKEEVIVKAIKSALKIK